MGPSDIRKRVLARNPDAALQVKKDLAFQVARHLEEARLAKGYSQQILAEKAGTYQANIARAESGNSLPSLSFLKRIADAFETYLIPPKFAFLEEIKLERANIDAKTENNFITASTSYHDGNIIFGYSTSTHSGERTPSRSMAIA